MHSTHRTESAIPMGGVHRLQSTGAEDRGSRLIYEAREPQAAAQHRAVDDAVQTMARTVAHELAQPLTVLLGKLELWAAGRYPPEALDTVRSELHAAAQDLAQRSQQLAEAQCYATRHLAGYRVLDLDRARTPPETARAPDSA